MKTLILIMMIPTLALAWELPPGLELVSVDGDHVTVRDTRTGIMDTYLIEGEPVINGWALEPTEDSLIFELVADYHMYLSAELQAYDFLNDGYIELVGSDLLLTGDPVVFLENDGHFNFVEVNRIESENSLYDFGNGDSDSLMEILTQCNRSMFIYEQTDLNSYADSLIWQVTPLPGNVRVWPRFSDLDDDGIMEVSFQNSLNFRKVDVYENTGDNAFDNNFNIPWPNTGPGQFACGDFDGDGHTEIVGGSDYGVLTIFESVASDSFVMVWQGDLGHPNAYMNRFIGDTDHDGFGEWVSGSHDFSHGGFFFKIFEGNGDSQYHEIYYDSLPGNPWLLGGVDAGDVDGDGDPEFLFASNANVALYKYSPISGWFKAWHLDNLQGAIVPHLVDVDGNDLEEIIITGNAFTSYTWFFRLVNTAVRSNEVAFFPEVDIYPNPTNSSLTISAIFTIDYPVQIDIYDIMGRMIYSSNASASKGSIIWNLTDKNAEEVKSGIYFIRLRSLYFSDIKKITILR